MNEDENLEQDSAVNDILLQNQELKNRNAQLGQAALINQGANSQDEQNLIHYQLETDKILERIEHFLKGDQVKFNEEGAYYDSPTKSILASVKQDSKSNVKYFVQELKEQKRGSETVQEVVVKIAHPIKDEDGETFYQEVDIMEFDSKTILGKMKQLKLKDLGYQYINVVDEDKKPLNEQGVAEFMRVISMYVTKETFLSYYKEDRINEIMGDLGDKLNDFFYCNYEKMGMDTKFKESKYTLLILNVLHTIESCYRRALEGAEQENLRTRAIVTQNQGFGGGGGHRSPSAKKRWSPIKPSTW